MDAQTIERYKAGMDYERTRKGPPEGFPRLPLLPGGRYVDPGFLALEREHLWKKSWLYAAHMDELPEVGSFKIWQRTGSPVLLVRSAADEVRAFYNTCRHRGAPVVSEENGQVRGGFTCKYHGWTYNLDGELINLRDKRDFVGLDMNCQGLTPVRCERLGDWIFVSEDPGAPPLKDYLGPVWSEISPLPLTELRLVNQQTFHLDCNVKVLQDAFLEVYHLKSIHPQTVDRFLDHRGSKITLWKNGHSLMLTPNRRPDWVDPGTVGMQEMARTNELHRFNNPSYNIYPNLVTPIAPTGLPFILFWPDGDAKMTLDVHWFAPDWGDGPRPGLWEQRLANFDRILDEDLQFCEDIQKSVESPGFKGMTLNYQERRIYHWHEELDRRIGPERVPETLRVPQVLGDWLDR